MATTTNNYALHMPEGNDNVLQAMVTNLGADMETIDGALTPTADPTQVPTGNGPYPTE